MANHLDHATLAALIAGVDHTARQHERTWGIDRLPALATTDMRAKFYRQQAKWSAALEAAYETDARPLTLTELQAITELSEGLRRGWVAMGAQATQDGHESIRPEVWEMTLQDGSVAALCRSVADAGAVEPGRYVSVWTLDEIVSVIAINLTVAQAEVKSVPKGMLRTGPLPDDLPFGDDDVSAVSVSLVNVSVGGGRRVVDLAAEFD